jgi:antitoxin (DNA-binding transcriptional repressor) of toxin-antitoxin stability system
MRIVTPLDLRRSLGSILDSASAGERFLIERDHRPIAVLVSVEDGRRLDDDAVERRRRALAALDRLTALGEQMLREHPDGPSAVESIRLERGRDDA